MPLSLFLERLAISVRAVVLLALAVVGCRSQAGRRPDELIPCRSRRDVVLVPPVRTSKQIVS
eukprot:scaffold421360_cov57-Attheya_sp.AAC.4